jgi:D-alanine transfer protein
MDKCYSTILYHLTVFIISLSLVVGIVFSAYLSFGKKSDIPLSDITIPQYDRIANYGEGLSQQYAMQSNLDNGGVTIFGSSELSYQGDEVPYRFFKNKTNKNVLAYGEGGSQSLTILSQLSAYYSQQMFDNARLVIIVSPSWFDTDGTDIAAFKSAMPTSMLMRLLYESEVSYEYKKYIQEYINTNFDELSWPKPIDLAWNYALPRKEAKVKYLNRVFAYLAKYTQYYPYKIYDGYVKSSLLNNNATAAGKTTNQKFDWNKLFAESIKLQTSKVTNNEYGISDDYFNAYVKKRIDDGNFPIKAPIVSAYGKEYRDFVLLVEFCKMFKHKPLFVIIPFNNKAYTGLENYNPVINKVTTTLNAADMPTLNMWKDGDKPGVMADIMHTGAYGWQRINQAIYKQFIEK